MASEKGVRLETGKGWGAGSVLPEPVSHRTGGLGPSVFSLPIRMDTAATHLVPYYQLPAESRK
jgi:hypothetical protein